MQKKWVYKQIPETAKVEALAKELNISHTLATILLQRGVNTFQQAKDFFRPSLDQLNDPFLMKDMDKAISRIIQAMTLGQKILIYGDYDVDGTTAVALVYGFLSTRYDQLDYYIPDRYGEGYGLSAQGIAWAAENDFKLIITLDCGIKAVKLIDGALDVGLEFIVCDHHIPGDQLPGAVAILDAKQKDCHYPYDELSGCGVGFKLIQAFCLKQGIPIEVTYDYLDLVAVSIAADLVPLTGENRILTHYGLRILNKKPRPGLQALIDISGIRGKVDISEIVFGLAPRINAAGRIDHAKAAVQLLLSKQSDEATPWAIKVNEKNSTRKHVDASITKEAIAMIEENDAMQEAKSTVLYKEDWHKGVIGIVASRCIERYYRPTIVLTESKEKATGSARSVAGFDIYEAIAACSDLLDAYGGHKYAAGLTMPVDKVSTFRQRFEEIVSTTITEDMLTPVLEIDQIIDLEEIHEKFYRILQQIGPFGPENMTPVFVTKNLQAHAKTRILKDEHLKFRIRSAPGHYFDGVAFGMARYAEQLNQGAVFDMAYTLELNEFRGERVLQMMVKDIKIQTLC